MRDLKDKFLVRAWLVDPTARIILRTRVDAQAISLEKSNLLQSPSLHSTAAGRIADANGQGATPSGLGVRWLPRSCGIVVGTRASLLQRPGVWQIFLNTPAGFGPSFGRCCVIRLRFRRPARRLRDVNHVSRRPDPEAEVGSLSRCRRMSRAMPDRGCSVWQDRNCLRIDSSEVRFVACQSQHRSTPAIAPAC